MESLWQKRKMCLIMKWRERKRDGKFYTEKRQREKITQQTSFTLNIDYDFLFVKHKLVKIFNNASLSETFLLQNEAVTGHF